jgi:hypothetical protein
MRRFALSGLFLLALAAPAAAEPALPVVEDVEWAPLRDQCRRLLDGLDALHSPLPRDTADALKALLAEEPRDPAAAAAEVQKLLDAQCLLGVSINAESRVKAARGPLAAELRQGEARVVLVKVQNDAGVTHAPAVGGPGLVGDGPADDGRWLEAVFVTEPPFARKLSGRRLEYVALRLTAREAGKREATFKFDVGQGTQDLGFRAETPVLFTIRPR